MLMQLQQIAEMVWVQQLVQLQHCLYVPGYVMPQMGLLVLTTNRAAVHS